MQTHIVLQALIWPALLLVICPSLVRSYDLATNHTNDTLIQQIDNVIETFEALIGIYEGLQHQWRLLIALLVTRILMKDGVHGCELPFLENENDNEDLVLLSLISQLLFKMVYLILVDVARSHTATASRMRWFLPLNRPSAEVSSTYSSRTASPGPSQRNMTGDMECLFLRPRSSPPFNTLREMTPCALCTEEINVAGGIGATHAFCLGCCVKLSESSFISACLLSCKVGDDRVHHLNPKISGVDSIPVSAEDEEHPEGFIPATIQKLKNRVQNLKMQLEQQDLQHQLTGPTAN
ncbi:hypothetical protein FPV67DRAFT_1450685 [Lyophyllum atratum]|nr:hypothetical protein FPV67DRAFT_1450685 [Lyophyllum atratum]